jgi:N-acetylmuramoyl-L-alanine amidase
MSVDIIDVMNNTKVVTWKDHPVVIVIDPGHGYSKGNTGAASYIYTYKVQGDKLKTEKANILALPQYVIDDPDKWIVSVKEDHDRSESSLVFDVSAKLKSLLENDGYSNVILTRTERGPIEGNDDTETRQKRIEIANDNNADYYISIHADGIDTNYTISGSHVIYPNTTDANIEKLSKKLASDMLSKYDVVEVETESPKKDVRGLQILKGTNLTKRKVLVELGFVTSPKDAKALFTSVDKIAEQLKEGLIINIKKYF